MMTFQRFRQSIFATMTLIAMVDMIKIYFLNHETNVADIVLRL